jgi:glutaredoxin
MISLNKSVKNNWTIYTKSKCVFCFKVKELLENEKYITIINCDDWLKDNEQREIFLNEIKNITGCEWKTFPMVFIDDKFIGGYNETVDYIDKIKKVNLVISEDF